jgi:hypothetical protein
MTHFRHIKLSDSIVMANLVEIAHKKGWLKEEPTPPLLTKQASQENSEIPADDLDANLLRLASLLRAESLVSYATNLEERFVNYKVAKTNLYKAFKETGESFLEEAHPEGDPILTDNPEGMIEGLTTKHKKIVDMIQKQPTGKYAGKQAASMEKLSADHIIAQVKLALGQEAPIGGARNVEFPKGWADFLQKPIETAPIEPINPATVAGGEGLFGGLAAKFLATTAGAGAAIAAGAIAGGLIGNEVFENKFYAEELTDAVKNLLSETDDIKKYEDEFNNISAYVEAISTNFGLYSAAAKNVSSFRDKPSPEGMKSLEELETAANAMSSNAEKIREYMKSLLQGGTSVDLIVWKSKSAQFRDIEIAAANLSKVITTKTLPGLVSVANVIRKALDNNSSSSQTASSEQLVKEMRASIAIIDSLISKVNASNARNKDALLKWLNESKEEATSLLNEFNGEAPGIKAKMHDRFEKELTTLNGYLRQFSAKVR